MTMITSAFLLLTTLTAAAPAGKLPWFEFHDYPMKAFEKHWEGVTRFDLLVDPNGRVANCSINQSSGHEDLDKTTCSLASFRARFAPARGPDGEPAYGVYRSQAIWVIPEHSLPNTEPGPDLQVSLSKLPQGTIDPPAVQLAYMVDQQGRISECGLLGGSPVQPPALVDVACRELASRLPQMAAKTSDGRSVAAVRTAAVLFTVSSGAPGRPR
jgi:TonB family protein